MSISKYEEYKQARKTLNRLIKKDGREIIREALQPMFDLHPEVKLICWTQGFLVDTDNSGFRMGEFHILVEEAKVDFKNVSSMSWCFGDDWEIFDKQPGQAYLRLEERVFEKHCPQFMEAFSKIDIPPNEIFDHCFGWQKIALQRDGSFEIDEDYDGYSRA